MKINVNDYERYEQISNYQRQQRKVANLNGSNYE